MARRVRRRGHRVRRSPMVSSTLFRLSASACFSWRLPRETRVPLASLMLRSICVNETEGRSSSELQGSATFPSTSHRSRRLLVLLSAPRVCAVHTQALCCTCAPKGCLCAGNVRAEVGAPLLVLRPAGCSCCSCSCCNSVPKKERSARHKGASICAHRSAPALACNCVYAHLALVCALELLRTSTQCQAVEKRPQQLGRSERSASKLLQVLLTYYIFLTLASLPSVFGCFELSRRGARERLRALGAFPSARSASER